MKKTKVYIDPTIRLQYSTYYILGLYEVFGKENVKFSGKYFKDLDRKSESNAYNHYMAFVIKSKYDLTKYIIDFRDKRTVKDKAYIWCDKYAKINFSETITEKKYRDKIIFIPPSFCVKIWGKYEMIYHLILNFLKSNFSLLVPLKRHFTDYYSQYKRPTLNEYTNHEISKTKSNFVFMIGTLWPHKNCIEGTNLLRKSFVEACVSNKNISFEGGFFTSPKHPQYEEFKEFAYTKRIKTSEYIKKTKKSLFVFNTPAVHECHGWKLGEYLAMGKAIISSPITNSLPKNMVHGKNIHFISNPSEIKDAISLIAENHSYCNSLEKGAQDYYNNYSSPKAAIEHILKD
jgi:hypothetical protein